MGIVYTNKELIIMIGITGSGKSYYVNRDYIKSHQYIGDNYVSESIRIEPVPKNDDFKYAFLSVLLRSHMLRGLPIVIDEKNLNLEGLFIFKKYANEYNYKTKAILIETPVQVCCERLQVKEQKYMEFLEKQEEAFKEIKQILNMKHQKIFDHVEEISYGG